MKEKFIELYKNIAVEVSKLSYAKRLQVGAVIVKDDKIISIGYNGMPSGWANVCEDEISSYDPRDYKPEDGWKYDPNTKMYSVLKSRPEVLHAERNALDKLTKSGGIGADNATMFCTHAPCLECAKSIYGAGITQFFYQHHYKHIDGLLFLRRCGVIVKELE